MTTPTAKRRAWREYMAAHPEKAKKHRAQNRANKRWQRAKNPRYGQFTAGQMRRWRAGVRLRGKGGSKYHIPL